MDDTNTGATPTATIWLDGDCPACYQPTTLFVTHDDAGTYVTCTTVECPDPLLADQQGALEAAGPAAALFGTTTPTPADRCPGCDGDGYVTDHDNACHHAGQCVGCGGVQAQCQACSGTGQAGTARCTGNPCTCTNGIGCANVPVEEW